MKTILSFAVVILLSACGQTEEPKTEPITVQDMEVDSLVFKLDTAKAVKDTTKK